MAAAPSRAGRVRRPAAGGGGAGGGGGASAAELRAGYRPITAFDIDAALGAGRYAWRGRMLSAGQYERARAEWEAGAAARLEEEERRSIEYARAWEERQVEPAPEPPPPRSVDRRWMIAVNTPVVVGAAAIAFNDAAAKRARWYNVGPEAFALEPALMKLVRLRLDPHFAPSALWRSALEAELKAACANDDAAAGEGRSLYDQVGWWRETMRDDAVALAKLEGFIASTVRTWLPKYLGHLARGMLRGVSPASEDVKVLYRLIRMARHDSWARMAAGGGV